MGNGTQPLPQDNLPGAGLGPQGNPLIIDPSLETTPPPDDPDNEFGVGTVLEGLGPLQLGQTLIIYHPFAQHPAEIIDTANLMQTREPDFCPPSKEPYAPFGTCADFEQAEIFIHHNCTNTMINDQLQLNQRFSQSGEPGIQMMRNAHEMHNILSQAGQYQDTSSVSLLHLLKGLVILMWTFSSGLQKYLSHIPMASMRRTGLTLYTIAQPWKQSWMSLKILISVHHLHFILNATMS